MKLVVYLRSALAGVEAKTITHVKVTFNESLAITRPDGSKLNVDIRDVHSIMLVK